ncbi:hypothetical protein V8E51_011532 [Hyaloscypha variabilis]
MHFSHSFQYALLSTLLASISAHPTLTKVLRRFTFDTSLSLTGTDGVCAQFGLTNGNLFSALCVGMGPMGKTLVSSVNLDDCIVNQGGNLGFLAHGNFSSSCSACTLDDSLNLTCSCRTGVPNAWIESTVNIDGTTSDNGSGAFVMEAGELACRAPEPGPNDCTCGEHHGG